MSTTLTAHSTQQAPTPEAPRKLGVALGALTSLFFMWGFITCLNDILIPYLKGAFSLSYTQAMLIQFCFFGAYFVVSVPAGRLVANIGYQRGIVAGLGVAALGCLLFYPAAAVEQYSLFLIALFVLAAGVTILQVSANPYVSILGAPETASSRLTMTQAFNSLGTTVAPFFGGLLLFSTTGDHSAADASAVKVPYLILAAMLLMLAVIFAKLRLPVIHHEKVAKGSETPLTRYPHLILGAIGIFLYVGAEVSIGSFLVSFLAQENIAGLTEAQAAHYIAYYWGGAMVGRFIGAVVMQRIDAGKVLAFNGVMVMVLICIAVVNNGSIAMWALLAVGLFNSIMFPTIFSLAIKGLGKDASRGSGLLCLAIVGGAIVPLLQGVVADSAGLQLSFILPAMCYVFISHFGLVGSRAGEVNNETR
ncbi:sugar MFS transporter (plasmid) [Pseudoalteromonas sp. T1lg65]|uniref:sugar MFS transporter n=1 Tax=Pseudoalteromonas sp. T1lg65 TaxID=2077101 RepID=UPI003F79170B